MMSSSIKTKRKLLVRSLLIAIGLLGFKLVVFFFTNATSILASAVDSLMDFLVSLVNFLFLKSASKPADHNHPYGHGKIESLAGLFQGVIIAAMALGLAVMAVKRLIYPEFISKPFLGVLISFIGLILSLWHIRNLKKSVEQSNSQLMASEYLHYASDILAYLGVMVALILYKFTGSPYWDPVVTLLIVIYILRGVTGIFQNALSELLDEQLPDSVLKELDHIIRSSHPKVLDYHDLRTRRVGEAKFIEFHVVIKEEQFFSEAHNITETVVKKIQQTYPEAIVTAHADPEDAEDIPGRH
ncbi:MAG: cation diffusion facilitator family transporter [Elusimicrobiota bacterium]